jgi:hypothetical protein
VGKNWSAPAKENQGAGTTMTDVHNTAQMNATKPPHNSQEKVELPLRLGLWERPDLPRVITAKNIFEYMDGAGELYLGYRFKRLEVFEYTSKQQDSILLELYWMETPGDAYGLLSGDWGGEPVNLNREQTPVPLSVAPSWSALYGAGLLRLRSGNLYARIMAYQETTESKKAILELGQRIVAGRQSAQPPALAAVAPPVVASKWTLHADRLCYFRSHLVLNSMYFLSTGNILHLGPAVDAIISNYENMPRPANQKDVRLLMVRYPSREAATQALSSFQQTYLEKAGQKAIANAGLHQGFQLIEDGWVGYGFSGRDLALVFECPDEPTAQAFIHQSMQAFEKLE